MILGLNETQEALYLDFIKSNDITIHSRTLQNAEYLSEVKSVVAAIVYEAKYLSLDEYEKANMKQGYSKALEDIEAFKEYIQKENSKELQRDKEKLEEKIKGAKEIAKYLARSKLESKLKDIAKIIDELERLSKAYDIPILKQSAINISKEIKHNDYMYDSIKK